MKEYNEQVVETLDDAGCIIANKNIIIDNLQARIAELEAENARLKAECDDIKQVQFPRKLEAVAVGWKKQLAAAQVENERLENQVLARDAELWGRTQEILGLKEQLAAEQLNNKRLRDALTTCVCAMQDYQAGIGITEMFDKGERLGRKALATPSSTEALDKYVAEKVKAIEAERDYHMSNAKHVYEQCSKITRQRDLAVEALEWAADVLPPSDPGGIGGCDCPVCRALETIKESDGK